LSALHSFPTRRSSDLPRGHGGEEVRLSAPKTQARSIEGFSLQSSPYVRVRRLLLGESTVKSRRVAETSRKERGLRSCLRADEARSEEHTSELQSPYDL